MKESHALPLLLAGLGLALVAAFGLGLEVGPPGVWTALVFVGVVLVLAAQHWMARLPEEHEDAP
jgi:ABC-type sulfate transport system permease component